MLVDQAGWAHRASSAESADACGDAELREILLHNKREEIEHAMMTLEWIRRRNPHFDRLSRQYLYTTGSIAALEEGKGEDKGNDGAVSGGTLGIGSLKRARR